MSEIRGRNLDKIIFDDPLASEKPTVLWRMGYIIERIKRLFDKRRFVSYIIKDKD